MMRRGLAVLPAAWLAACAGTIDGGPTIDEIAAKQDQPAPDAAGVQKSAQVRPSAELALQNYEKLLSLPQEPAARAETLRRLADLNLQLDEQNPGTLEESTARQRRSIQLYNMVLTEFPTAESNDRVLYQLSRAHQNIGETAKAEEALQRLIRDYPKSAYIDDAFFRRGELLFKLGQFDDAAVAYKHVLDLGPTTPFFQPAQYKYGWAQYRQSNYEIALDVFMAILGRELPPGAHTDAKVALEGVGPGKKDLSQDSMRVVSLSFAQLGGGDAVQKYFAKRQEPAFIAMLYANLGDHLVEKRRYTDAARAYGVFIETHPKHELAPAFQTRAIDALAKGGFVDQVVEAKERYVELFDPKGKWFAGAPTPAVLKELRQHLEDLAKHYQARGQKTLPHDPAAAKLDFAAATRWYRRLLEQNPKDPRAPELRFLAAEAMLEAGDTLGAAAEYNKIVADYPGYEKAPESAYAALLAYQRHSTEVAPAQRAEAQRKSVAAALQLAERFPKHEKAIAALTRAAEDLYLLKEWDRAVGTAARVLSHDPPAPAELRRTALSVTGDTHYSQKRFDKAEAAYYELLGLLPPEASEERTPIVERIAESIYKQAEAWRDAGNPQAAADTFLRIGARVPGSKIRAAADYDAGAMLIAAKDWGRAAAVLEAFRATHTTSGLLPDVDKKLAVVYQNDGKPKDAALVLERIQARATETADVRLEAAWLEVSLLDQARDAKAWPAYEAYVKQYPRPLDRAMEARRKLADYAGDKGDAARRQHWLREIIAADTGAGTARTPRSKQLAAEATLEFARLEAQRAGKLPLKLPLAQSVKQKKEAVERAIAELTKASDYNVAGVTTAATYELGVLYQAFSKSLLDSERPRRLSALEREQYDLLLEEQAFPFEEKAIEWHETNLKRATQGIHSEWIARSLHALGQLSPGKYGKREQTAESYDALR